MQVIIGALLLAALFPAWLEGKRHAPDAEGKHVSSLPEQISVPCSSGCTQSWSEIWNRRAHVYQDPSGAGEGECAGAKGLLRRLTGLETLAFNDGAFADEVTLNWINHECTDDMSVWQDEPYRTADNDILVNLNRDTDGLDGRDSDAPGHESRLKVAVGAYDGPSGRTGDGSAGHHLRELDDAAGSIHGG